MHQFVIVTGRPGVGKTTLVMRVLEKLRKENISFVGFYCPEVRVGRQRIGFHIRSIDGSISGWLARVNGCDGPSVGRYNTCREAESVASAALRGFEKADLVVIDEIGPMELKLIGIRRQIISVINSTKPGLFVVHYRLRDPEVLRPLKARGLWFEVTIDNRDLIIEDVYNAVLDAIKSMKRS